MNLTADERALLDSHSANMDASGRLASAIHDAIKGTDAGSAIEALASAIYDIIAGERDTARECGGDDAAAVCERVLTGLVLCHSGALDVPGALEEGETIQEREDAAMEARAEIIMREVKARIKADPEYLAYLAQAEQATP